MLEVQQRRSISGRIRNTRALAFARAGRRMKQRPDVLEWLDLQISTQIAVDDLTAAKAKEQVEYNKAVRCALKAMGYQPRENVGRGKPWPDLF
jgi:hypothetical protein